MNMGFWGCHLRWSRIVSPSLPPIFFCCPPIFFSVAGACWREYGHVLTYWCPRVYAAVIWYHLAFFPPRFFLFCPVLLFGSRWLLARVWAPPAMCYVRVWAPQAMCLLVPTSLWGSQFVWIIIWLYTYKLFWYELLYNCIRIHYYYYYQYPRFYGALSRCEVLY